MSPNKIDTDLCPGILDFPKPYPLQFNFYQHLAAQLQQTNRPMLSGHATSKIGLDCRLKRKPPIQKLIVHVHPKANNKPPKLDTDSHSPE